MDAGTDLISVRAMCRIYFQDELGDGEEPTRSMRQTIQGMCRDKVLPATKIGKKWFIRKELL